MLQSSLSRSPGRSCSFPLVSSLGLTTHGFTLQRWPGPVCLTSLAPAPTRLSLGRCWPDDELNE